MSAKKISTVSRNADALLPWSYSKVSAYEKCPRVAFHRYIEKRREARSDALERGDRVHKDLEAWARGGFKKLAPAWKAFQREAKQRKLHEQVGVIVEEMWSFNAKLEPVAYRSPEEWLRVKCDLAVPALDLIIDHKTGKQYPEHRDQGEIYGAGYLARHPKSKGVDVEFWYVDQGVSAGMTVLRAELPRILARAHERVAEMIEDVEFKPKPSRLCGWCGFSRTKGGPCKEG